MILKQPQRRSAFTLIEILVVIAIIAILAGLLLAGVMSFVGKGDEAANRNDVVQLAAAVRNFEAKYGPLPSRIFLGEQLAFYNSGPTPEEIVFRQYSLAVLKKIWPRIFTRGHIDWNGDGQVNGRFKLEGDQCLVFFLGGMQSTSGGKQCIGFSTNPANPAQLGGSRHDVFFEFKSNRLAYVKTQLPFFSYLDVYEKQPFAYFNANDVRASVSPRYANLPMAQSHSVDFDCQRLEPQPPPLPPKPQPYRKSDSPRRYYIPFQIISAGENETFGPGGLWSPSVGVKGAGEDDVTNFHGGLMGAVE